MGDEAARYVAPSELRGWEEHPNPRENDDAVAGVAASIERYGFGAPIVALEDGRIIAGETRWKAATRLELERVPVRFVELEESEARAYRLADNRLAELSSWHPELLAAEIRELTEEGLDLGDLGWSPAELLDLVWEGLEGGVPPLLSPPKLTDRFLVPPFSTLDSRQGYWRERKQRWLDLGFASDEGRAEDVLMTPAPGSIPGFYSRKEAEEKRLGRELTTAEFTEAYRPRPRVSTFDPVLCEIAYRWFCPAGGRVLDPFAGGSVRGIVAELLGLSYTGIDLRPEQVAANESQAAALEVSPSWIVGDSLEALPDLDGPFDLVFTCPPYFNLEVYSEDPRDISTMAPEAFVETYGRIMAAAVEKLADNGFVVVVVGDVRDKHGFYRDLVGVTVEALRAAGAALYNRAVLIQPVGSLAIRAPRAFESGRKLGMSHQDVLVFFKGDPKQIRATLGDVRIEPVPTLDAEPPSFRAMQGLEPPVLEERGRFLVVRDDVIMGGTKQRYIARVLEGLEERGVVYGTPVWGGAQVAIAAAAAISGHEAHLFCAERKKKTARQLLVEELGGTLHPVSPGYLTVVSKRARDFAEAEGLHLLKWGAPLALEVIAEAAAAIDLPEDLEEVWLAGGSGTMLRGLLRAWGDRPALRFFVVGVGARRALGELEQDERVTVLWYDRKFEQLSRASAPFPSCRHYDAKAWELAEAHRGEGRALFWNVARHHGEDEESRRAVDLWTQYAQGNGIDPGAGALEPLEEAE